MTEPDSELTAESRAFLAEVRATAAPAAGDRARILAAISAGTVAGATAASGPAAAVGPSVGSAGSAGSAAATSGLQLWLAGGALSLLMTGWAALVWDAATVAEVAPAVPVITAAAPAPAAPPIVVPDAAASSAKTEAVEPRAAEAPLGPTEARAPRSKPGAPADSDLGPQLELLESAYAAWRSGATARTLGLLDQHVRLYPRSQLGAQRTSLRVLCLCKLGQSGEARALAGSPIPPALRGSCVDQ